MKRTKRLLPRLLLIVLQLCIVVTVLFTILDFFPAMHKYLAALEVKYYMLRQHYVGDQELVFKRKPNLEQHSLLGQEVADHEILGAGYEPVPYHAKFNQDGFRVNSFSGQPEIVVVGDSFIEGAHRDDRTFSEYLTRISGLKAANLGVAWYGPPQYLAVLKRYGLVMKPRVALLGFFEGNDIRDTDAYLKYQQSGSYYEYSFSELGFAGRFAAFLDTMKGHGQELVKRWVRNPVAKFRGRYVDGRMNSAVELQVGDQRYWDIFAYKVETRSPAELALDPLWIEMRRILSDYKALCLEHGIVPYVMFIPCQSHIYSQYTTPRSGTIWLAEREAQIAARESTRQALQAAASELGLELIDLTDLYYKQAAEGVLLYNRYDGHWNDKGREAAAQYAASVLKAAASAPLPADSESQ